MKKALLLSTLLFLANCKNITHQDYILDVNNQTKLPALEAVIDATNLENVFSLGGFAANSNNIGTANRSGWVQTSAISGTSFRDPRMQDTMTLFDDFAKVLTLADHTIIADIYAAREKDTGIVSSKKLADATEGAIYLESFRNIEEYILNNAKPGDVVITMGAGNIYKVGEELLNK